MGAPAAANIAGFSGTIELEGLEPLVNLVRRLRYDAELRVRTEEGHVGLLRYAGGELAGGVFEGACGPLALERILALRSGSVELEVLSPEPALSQPSLSQPSLSQPALAEQALGQAPATPSTPQVHLRRRVEATSAIVEPAAPRSWLWAIAPGLALALWLAIELAGRLSPRLTPQHDPGDPAAESAEPRPPRVAR
jgi:hypothetical protein